MSLPLVEELSPAPDVEQAFVRLSRRPHCLFFDSALRHQSLGRYSYLSADPFDYFELPADGRDALSRLERRLQGLHSESADAPPFQGGAAGLFSYDLNRSLERTPSPRFDEFQTPALAVGFYDVVVAFDHQSGRAWIVSQGFPETGSEARQRRAARRIEQMKQWLGSDVSPIGLAPPWNSVPVDQLAPQHGARGAVTSNFSPDGFRAAVQKAIDYIYAGDVFQVNIAQRLLRRAMDDSVSLYLRLRRHNPATFAGYFDLGQFQIVSASPERFVKVHGGEVEARPIKGTRGRTRRAEADLFAGDDLKQSEKDRAENVMIVDLLRNDLSRVCLPESVHVSQLCELEVYEYVQHLVSAVRGELSPGLGPLDVIRAAFPGGSIVGAPKVRAMEIIAEIEPTARGPYCGSLGYVGFDGSMDLNILIRTITAGRGWWQAPVGGGVVSQSTPELELEETWHKAEGLLRAM